MPRVPSGRLRGTVLSTAPPGAASEGRWARSGLCGAGQQREGARMVRGYDLLHQDTTNYIHNKTSEQLYPPCRRRQGLYRRPRSG